MKFRCAGPNTFKIILYFIKKNMFRLSVLSKANSPFNSVPKQTFPFNDVSQLKELCTPWWNPELHVWPQWVYMPHVGEIKADGLKIKPAWKYANITISKYTFKKLQISKCKVLFVQNTTKIWIDGGKKRKTRKYQTWV